MRLAIGVPSNGEMKSEMVTCLIHALFQTPMSSLGLVFPCGCLIHENRNAIAQEALDKDYDYLMCIDADITFPANAINTLLSRNKHIIGGAYNKRGRLPRESTVNAPPGPMPTQPFKVDGLGMGFVLINMGVFKLIDKPWFYYEFANGTNDFYGEDYSFFKKVRSKGLEVWCDPTIELDHIGDYKY